MNKTVEKILPVILSILGGGGVVATAVLSSKAAVKASERIKIVKEENKDIDKDIIRKEVIKSVIPCYIPTAICGSLTIASIVSGTIISRKTEAALAASCVAIDQGYRRYKNKVKDILGVDKHNDIIESIAKDEFAEKHPAQPADNRKLYWMEWTGFFYADPVKMLNAINNMNLRLCANNYCGYVDNNKMGYITIGEILKDADAELLEPDKAKKFENYGWSTEYLGDIWDDQWIYFFVSDNEHPYYGKYRTIIFETAEPVNDPAGWEYERWEEQYAVIESDVEDKAIEIQMASNKEKEKLNEKCNENN